MRVGTERLSYKLPGEPVISHPVTFEGFDYIVDDRLTGRPKAKTVLKHDDQEVFTGYICRGTTVLTARAYTVSSC